MTKVPGCIIMPRTVEEGHHGITQVVGVQSKAFLKLEFSKTFDLGSQVHPTMGESGRFCHKEIRSRACGSGCPPRDGQFRLGSELARFPVRFSWKARHVPADFPQNGVGISIFESWQPQTLRELAEDMPIRSCKTRNWTLWKTLNLHDSLYAAFDVRECSLRLRETGGGKKRINVKWWSVNPLCDVGLLIKIIELLLILQLMN